MENESGSPTELTEKDWQVIKKRFETGDAIVAIASDYQDLPANRIRQRAFARGWRNPRKLALAAQKRLQTRRANLNDSELAKLMNRVLDARKSTSMLARKLLLQAHKDLKSGKLRLRSVKEIHECIDLLERAAGVERDKEGAHQPSIVAYNAQFLMGQGPRPRELTEAERLAIEAEVEHVNGHLSPDPLERVMSRK